MHKTFLDNDILLRHAWPVMHLLQFWRIKHKISHSYQVCLNAIIEPFDGFRKIISVFPKMINRSKWVLKW